jgi:hypothetical protein
MEVESLLGWQTLR